MTRPTFTLPLVSTEVTATADWHGFTSAGALAAPEPDAPQGVYAVSSAPTIAPASSSIQHAPGSVELLAPAGGPDAAFAAFHYGADAIYLGLKKFSARAEAENFTIDELSEVVAYAHSLTPRRRVFVTLNTLIRNDELPELVEALTEMEAIGVDALIIQDLGVYHLVRRHFPTLELHASTQLAVHNRAGADALHRLGFARVVLARELTFEEVHDITAATGVETEVFIHGALCYSYSGLCLFSSQSLGRSGNRGKCAYSCRDLYEVEGAPDTLRDGSPVRRDPATGFPFSMKDLALPDHLPALRSAGVSCFKIEGRKKSPLYVATTTDYYRKLLDGTLDESKRPDYEADLQTVFSRPWTHLFVDSHKDKEVADRDTVGHRGSAIGEVMAIYTERQSTRLRFRTARALERHDGLQVDLPILAKPFGFAVDRMWQLGKRVEAVFEAPAGALIEVELPPGHPVLPIGAPVYCSSSQAVKRQYRHDRPRPGVHRACTPMHVELTITPEACIAIARAGSVEVRRDLPGVYTPARDVSGTETAVRATFAKLGDTALSLADLTLHNPDGLFVPVSRLNGLRRDVTQATEAALATARHDRAARVLQEINEKSDPINPEKRPFRWSIKVDRIAFLDAFTPDDWADIDEVVIDIARDHPAILANRLTELAGQIGHDRIRLALPPLTRKWEENGLVHKIDHLRAAGWRRWEAANLSAWTYLGLDPSASTTGDFDVATDWSVYAINRVAAAQLLGMGVSRFTLSPEDGLSNLKPMFRAFGPRAVLIVYQDTPMFLAESCAYANLIGGCPGKAACKFESMEMVSSHGERVTALDYHCRTIVLNQGPFCLSTRLRDLAKAGAESLRVDFLYRLYEPQTVVDRWRAVRAGKAIPGGNAANFDRGLL